MAPLWSAILPFTIVLDLATLRFTLWSSYAPLIIPQLSPYGHYAPPYVPPILFPYDPPPMLPTNQLIELKLPTVFTQPIDNSTRVVDAGKI